MITIAGIKLGYSDVKELRKRLNLWFDRDEIRYICIYTKDQAKDYLMDSLGDMYDEERMIAMKNGVRDLLIVSLEEFLERIDIEYEIENSFYEICIGINKFYVTY